jgi:hypothetical protein
MTPLAMLRWSTAGNDCTSFVNRSTSRGSSAVNAAPLARMSPIAPMTNDGARGQFMAVSFRCTCNADRITHDCHRSQLPP